MEKETLEKDIKVFYVIAEKFPDTVPQAYEKLHSLITDKSSERKYFGISHQNEKGVIIYKACAEELHPGEAEEYHCESFIIRKGDYISITIKNHGNDPESIGNAFQKLLAHPDIDPQGYCLEGYVNYTDPDVKCMVGLKS